MFVNGRQMGNNGCSESKANNNNNNRIGFVFSFTRSIMAKWEEREEEKFIVKHCVSFE